MKDKLIDLLTKTGEDFAAQKLVEYELIEGHDIHAFYRLCKNPSKVIHVQGYPGIGDEKEIMISARMMDYNEMIRIRESGRVSPGNEHLAVIGIFPNFNSSMGIMIPYDANILEDLLAENVPELKALAIKKSII